VSSAVAAGDESVLRSQITKYICSSTTPNLLSVREHYMFSPLIGYFASLYSQNLSMSLAKWVPSHFSPGSAIVLAPLRAICFRLPHRHASQAVDLLHEKRLVQMHQPFLMYLCGPTWNRTTAAGFGDQHSTSKL